jgi:hypothetical protein
MRGPTLTSIAPFNLYLSNGAILVRVGALISFVFLNGAILVRVGFKKQKV